MGVIFRGDSASCACLNLGSKAAYPSPTFPTEFPTQLGLGLGERSLGERTSGGAYLRRRGGWEEGSLPEG